MSEDITIGTSTARDKLADERDYLELHLIICRNAITPPAPRSATKKPSTPATTTTTTRPATSGSGSTRSAEHAAGSAAASTNCDRRYLQRASGSSRLGRR